MEATKFKIEFNIVYIKGTIDFLVHLTMKGLTCTISKGMLAHAL